MKKLSPADILYPCLLTLFFISLLAVTIPVGAIYGSDGDWFSQHVALAEQFRQIFYETGQIFPDYTLLGSGSNIYDISYYGFLRPDVLISFLLPGISMKYIISGYAMAEMLAAVNLCYFWLKKHVSDSFFAFLGALLFACGGFTYQAHHQIMFVNYLPFLFLALMGIDSMLEKGKTSLLTLSLFLLYLHSYYFSVSALFVCLIYFLYGYPRSCHGLKHQYFRKLFTKFITSVLLSIGMAAVLLIPTALDLLSNQKDSGTPTALGELFNVNLSMDSLLYSGYSCGLTLLCLYTLLLSIRRKSTRFMSITLLLSLTLNCVPYILSGFLYIRYKVLIPLVPLLLFLCVQTLEELYQQKIRHSLPLLACCLALVLFRDHPQIILTDFLMMTVTFFLCHLAKYQHSLLRYLSYLPLIIAPLFVFIIVNQHDTYITADDNRQELFSQEDLSKLSFDSSYRFDYLTTPFSTVNLTAPGNMGSTNLYSSITNSSYADYFYNTMGNPIRFRNRVALSSDANPFFSYLMGIRYIQTRPNYLPFGYKAVTPVSGGAVIAENPNVLPVAYTSTSLLAQTDYQKMDFPYNLMALTNYTVVDDRNLNTDGHTNPSGIAPVPQNWKDSYSFSFKEETSVTIPLDSSLKDKILILSFDVSSKKGNEVSININGTLNKLSGKNAPYPNRNHRFTYILSDADGQASLKLTLSKGSYTISNIRAYAANPDCIGNASAVPLTFEPQKGSSIVKGTATLNQNGYLVTSLPYRPGYRACVNGKKVTIQNINEGFVGFPLTAGKHEIEIFYSPPGKTMGIFISIISILLFFITLHKGKRYIQ